MDLASIACGEKSLIEMLTGTSSHHAEQRRTQYAIRQRHLHVARQAEVQLGLPHRLLMLDAREIRKQFDKRQLSPTVDHIDAGVIIKGYTFSISIYFRWAKIN